jgi:hypothetical protein
MELWPLLLFLLLISGTAGAGNANFFFFRNPALPGNFLRPLFKCLATCPLAQDSGFQSHRRCRKYKFLFFRNSTLPGNFLWPRAVPNLPAHYDKIKKPDSHPVLEFLSSNKQDYFFLLKR